MAKFFEVYGLSNALIPMLPPPLDSNRAPTSADLNYEVGQIWNYNVSSSVKEVYSFGGSNSGSAVWTLLGGTGSDVNTLTGDSGGIIRPSSGNINLLGGTGINTVGSGSTITFNVTGGGLEYTVVTADTPMAVNQGYITNKAGTSATMTLPATAAVGSVIEISGLGATSYSIAQNAGQMIHLDATTSTTGVGGSATPTSRYQTIRLLCVVANNEWNITYTSDAVTIV